MLYVWKQLTKKALLVDVCVGCEPFRRQRLDENAWQELREEYPDVATCCVTADTGFEHHKSIPVAKWVRLRYAKLRNPVRVTVVRNQKKTYLQMVEQWGKFPSAQFRQCTSDLKRGPIEKYIRNIRTLPHKVVINCVGIRAQESQNRARQSAWSVNQAHNRRLVASVFVLSDDTKARRRRREMFSRFVVR